MATLYWGGGTGTWDGTTTTNWYSDLARTTLAGVAPTAADDVVFDSSSSAASYTVTLSGTPVCRSWTMSGPAAGNVTVAGTVTINVYGDLTWTAGGIIISFTGIIAFAALSGSYTVTFNSISLPCSVYFGLTTGGQSSATWSLGSAVSLSGSLKYFQFQNGTFNTNNYNITTSGRLDASMTTYARTVNLGTSLITISSNGNQLFALGTSNLTFNASNSTIYISSTGSGVQMSVYGGITYGTIRLSPLSNTTNVTGKIAYTGTGTCTIGTLELFFATARLWAAVYGISAGTYTIGSITTSAPATSPKHRVQLLAMTGSSLPPFSPTAPLVTLNVTNISTTEYFDFRGIAAGGSASWSSSVWGDMGGNSGISFPSPKTVYLVGAAATYGIFDSLNWATSSGGSTSSANYPLAQDTIVIDNNGPASGATVAIGNYGSNWQPHITNIDFSNRTNPLTVSWANGLLVSGNILGSSAITSPNNSTVVIVGTGTSTITSNGQTFSFITVNKASTGGLTLGSALNTSAGFTINGGAFNTNNYNVTITGGSLTMRTSNSAVAFNTGSSIITTTAGLSMLFTTFAFTYSNDTKYVVAPTGTSSATIELGTSATPSNAKFYVAGSGTGTITFTTTSTNIPNMSYLEVTRANPTLIITAGKILNVSALKVASNIGNRAILKSSTTTTAGVASATKIDLDYIDVQYVTASNPNIWYAGLNSTSTGTTTNWVFGSYSKTPQKGNALAFLS